MKAVGGAIAGATAAVTAFGASSVKAGMDFDSAMSQVAATSNKSLDELNKEIGTVTIGTEKFTGNLREFAQYMGSTTAFSATQAAEALNYMALAGYDAQTSMETLPSVLNLAAAGGMELATASDMITDALSALGKGSDYAETLVDQMAITSSRSNTSVAQLGEAILTVGANAKQLAGGTTELNTVLGILADNGTKGAEGGTRLRNIMLALTTPIDKAKDALDELGVSAYDTATGEMRPLQDTLADLNAAMADFTQEEKNKTLNTIFNKVDLADVNYLLDVQADRWSDLSASIENSSGSAQKMADTQLDNLAGDITLFKSALEGAQIVISDGLAPQMRDFVQFGTDGLSRLTSAFKEGGLSGAMDEFSKLVAEGVNMIIEKAPELVKAGATLLNALVQGLVDNSDVVISSMIEIIGILGQAILDNLPLIFEAGLQIILGLAIALGENADEIIPAIVDCVLTIVETLIDNVDLLIDAAIAIIIGLADGLVNSQDKLLEKVPIIIGKLVMAIIKNAPKLLQAAIELLLSLGKGLVTQIQTLLEFIPRVVNYVINEFNNTDWGQIGRNLIDGFKKGITDRISSLLDTIKNAANSVVNAWNKIFDIHSPSKKFAYSAKMCIAGFDNEFEDYDPYASLQDSLSATPNLQASLFGSTGNNVGMDYASMGNIVKNALKDMAVMIDGRTAGMLLAQPVNNALGTFEARRI